MEKFFKVCRDWIFLCFGVLCLCSTLSGKEALGSRVLGSIPGFAIVFFYNVEFLQGILGWVFLSFRCSLSMFCFVFGGSPCNLPTKIRGSPQIMSMFVYIYIYIYRNFLHYRTLTSKFLAIVEIKRKKNLIILKRRRHRCLTCSMSMLNFFFEDFLSFPQSYDKYLGIQTIIVSCNLGIKYPSFHRVSRSDNIWH